MSTNNYVKIKCDTRHGKKIKHVIRNDWDIITDKIEGNKANAIDRNKLYGLRMNKCKAVGSGGRRKRSKRKRRKTRRKSRKRSKRKRSKKRKTKRRKSRKRSKRKRSKKRKTRRKSRKRSKRRKSRKRR